MSLKSVFEKLENLTNTPKTNDKIVLLKEYLQDVGFKTVVHYALSPHLTYHIKDIDTGDFIQNTSLGKKPLKDIFIFLSHLDKKGGTSDANKERLIEMSSIDPETLEVVRRIVNKDLRCGASTKTVNKAHPGLIKVVPYMRCSTEKHIDNITYPAIVEEKADGMYADITTFDDGETLFTTRNGKEIHQLDHLHKALRGKVIPGKVNSAELIIIKNGEVLPRKYSNGILNSCLNGTADPEEVKYVVARVWDTIPLEDWRKGESAILYDRRWFDTRNFIDLQIKHPAFQLIESKVIESIEEAKEFYQKIRNRVPKGEGAILKNWKSPWKNHTSKNQIKLKNVSVGEFRILDIEYGTTGKKYENCMGGLLIGTDDGLLQATVGTGFSDDDRGYYPIRKNNVVIGEDEKKRSAKMQYWDGKISSIISVEFESVIEDETRKDIKSLFLPRYDGLREDKSETDTLEELENR